ncbi:MAG: hypothetical protein ACN6O5_23905 [Achromobacter sp.]|uniref:hypothetical protein n=1 Tax=Achromobacter sp. TaxID=134375 RepID=UPI003D0140E1
MHERTRPGVVDRNDLARATASFFFDVRIAKVVKAANPEQHLGFFIPLCPEARQPQRVQLGDLNIHTDQGDRIGAEFRLAARRRAIRCDRLPACLALNQQEFTQ